MNSNQIERLLKIVANHDSSDHGLFWNSDLEFFAICNDVFWWATADLEAIETDADIDLLDQTPL